VAFDWPELKALSENFTDGAFGLSAITQVLLLSVAAELEDWSNWIGAGYELTDTETDEIDAAVALAENELMMALELGTMAFQDADNVSVSGGAIDDTEIGQTTPDLITGTIVEATESLRVDRPAGTAIGLGFRRSGLLRFFLYMDGLSESGSNNGSNLRLDRYDDSGVILSTILVLNRALNLLTVNSNMIFAGNITHSGSLFGMRGATATVAPTVTGSRAGNAALASLLTQLAAQNIIVNSTTA